MLSARFTEEGTVNYERGPHGFAFRVLIPATPGEEYDERTVTERLEPWCESGVLDTVSLRRPLVDVGVLRRESGLYGLAAAPVGAA